MPITNDDLIKIGFYEIGNFTISNTLLYDLGINRQLSASNVGDCNETLWICEVNYKDNTQIDDIVCLHNYDYCGFMTIQKVQTLIELIKYKNKPKYI